MSTADWNISGPIDHIWTPAEIAQIARAAQAFQAMLPNWSGSVVHLVRLDGISVIDGAAKVDWPQPGEPDPAYLEKVAADLGARIIKP